MKQVKTHIDNWFEKLQTKLLNEALPEKYSNIFLGSYCFAVKDEDRTTDEHGKYMNLTAENLHLLNTILKTDCIKVSKTREFNKNYNSNDYMGQEDAVSQAFDDYMYKKSKDDFEDTKQKQKEITAKGKNQIVPLPKNKYCLFPKEISYLDYLKLSPLPAGLDMNDIDKIYERGLGQLTQAKLDRVIRKYNKELEEFKHKGRFVSFSANLAGHTLRRKWKYGIIIDLKHLANGKANLPSSQQNINLYDTIYIVDHADLMKFEKFKKLPDSQETILPYSLTFSGTAQTPISEAAYKEFKDFLDIYTQEHPELKFKQTSKCITFRHHDGPSLKEFQQIMGEDTYLMSDLLNPLDRRTDSPRDEKELRYWLSAIDASDVLNLNGNIVGVLLPIKDEELRAAWCQKEAPVEVIEEVINLKTKIRQDSLAVCWVQDGEIIEIESFGLIPSALKQYIFELKNNL